MSNIDFSAKSDVFAPVRAAAARSNRGSRQKIQLVLNVAVITAAFLFVAAAVLGLFP